MGSLFRKSEEKFCTEGSGMLASGQVKWAEQVFLKGLRSYPNSFALWSNLANVYITAGDFSQAVNALSKGLDLVPTKHPSAWALKLNRGTCYLRLDQDAQALADLDAGIAEAGSDAPPQFLAKGYFYRALIHADDNLAKAQGDCDQAVQLDPGNPKYTELQRDLKSRQASPMTPEIAELGQKGAELLQAGDSQAALEVFEKLLAIEPQHAKGLQLKAAALHQLQRYEEEFAALKASYELNQNEVALFNLGPCCLALQRPDDARKYLTEFVRVGTHQATVGKAQMLLSTLSR